MPFGCLMHARRHKPACSSKERPISTHRDVVCEDGQGSRSVAGLEEADHRAQIRPMAPVGPAHPLESTMPGREMAGLRRGGRGGRGGLSANRGFILLILCSSPRRCTSASHGTASACTKCWSRCSCSSPPRSAHTCSPRPPCTCA